MTIKTALRLIRDELKHTSDAPHLDAERLLLHTLGRRGEAHLRSDELRRGEASWLYAHGEEELSDSTIEALTALVRRRQAGEPLAYIFGEWDFYGRPFYVTPDVLIPRPATEDLVEAALLHLQQRGTPAAVADIGTGSGCIAITLALELANFQFSRSSHKATAGAAIFDFQIIATDLSPAALAVARRNAVRHGVADRIHFLTGDMLKPLQGRQIDLIVSNPPYIPTAELVRPSSAQAARGNIETAGLYFEPRTALDGGADGQNYVRQLAAAGVPAIVESVGGRVYSLNL